MVFRTPSRDNDDMPSATESAGRFRGLRSAARDSPQRKGSRMARDTADAKNGMVTQCGTSCLAVKRLSFFLVAAVAVVVALFVSNVWAALKLPLPTAVVVHATSIVGGFAMLGCWRLSRKLMHWRIHFPRRLRFWCALPYRRLGRALLNWRRWVVLVGGLTVLLPILWIVILWVAVTYELPRTPVLYAAAVVAALAALVLWFAASRVLERRLRFSARELLLAIAALAVFLATAGRWFAGVSQQELAVRRLEARGGQVEYWGSRRQQNPWLSYNPTLPMRSVRIDSKEALSELLESAEHFRTVEGLTFGNRISEVEAEQAEDFERLPNLSMIEFIGSDIDDSTVRNLACWENGRVIWFHSCSRVTSQSLREIAGMPHVINLGICDEYGTSFLREKDLQALADCVQLQELTFSQVPQLTDKSVAVLSQLPNLKLLRLYGTSLTSQGLESLYDALPDTHISVSAAIATNGPGNVKRIRVQRMAHDARTGAVRTVADPADVAKLCAFADALKKTLDWKSTDAEPSDGWRVDFMGASRALYSVVLRPEGTYYSMNGPPPVDDRWFYIPAPVLSREDRAEVLRLLGIPEQELKGAGETRP